MNDLILTQKGRAGCITLNRPEALNALTYQMCIDIEAQLRTWRDDQSIELIIIDAAGDKAFCAGGDIADLYASAQRQDYAFGQKFWVYAGVCDGWRCWCVLSWITPYNRGNIPNRNARGWDWFGA